MESQGVELGDLEVKNVEKKLRKRRDKSFAVYFKFLFRLNK